MEVWPEESGAAERDERGDVPRAEELDALRIRQHAAARQAAYRARSYAVIGAIACEVAAVQLVIWTVHHVRADGWGAWPMGYALFAVAAQMIAVLLLRRAVALHREAARSALTEPTTPPDFSSLSDGSQQARNLEEIR